jgi:hypothetical protein
MQMMLHGKKYKKGEKVFMISDFKEKMASTLSDWMHLYKGLQNPYFGNIVDTTHVLGETMWFVMGGILTLFTAGITMDIMFTYRRNKMIYKQFSTVIWIV